jgi:hypothetical protein
VNAFGPGATALRTRPSTPNGCRKDRRALSARRFVGLRCRTTRACDDVRRSESTSHAWHGEQLVGDSSRCGALIRILEWAAVAKPNVGPAILPGCNKQTALFTGLAAWFSSPVRAIVPSWPGRWRDAVRGAPQAVCVTARWGTAPGGCPSVAKACCTFTTGFCTRPWHAVDIRNAASARGSNRTGARVRVAAVLAMASMWVLPYAYSGPDVSFLALAERTATAHLVLTLPPCLVLILRRPNERTAPAWLEHVTRATPMWLRASPVRT